VWETGTITLRLSRENISYLRFIFEGYDGLGIVTTTDANAAQVRITYPLSRKDLLEGVIGALTREGVVREEGNR